MRSPSTTRPGFRFDPIVKDHSVVLARRGHALAGDVALALETLARQRWLLPPRGITSRIIFDSWFTSLSVYPKVVNITTDSFSALTALVAQSDALLVVPYHFAEPALASGTVIALDVQRREELLPLGVLWKPDSISVAGATFCRWMASRTWRQLESPTG